VKTNEPPTSISGRPVSLACAKHVDDKAQFHLRLDFVHFLNVVYGLAVTSIPPLTKNAWFPALVKKGSSITAVMVMDMSTGIEMSSSIDWPGVPL
jgi:hypothetical protein